MDKIAFVSSVIGTILLARKNIWSWFFLQIGASIWIWYDYVHNLYWQASLFVIYTITNIYGWYEWRKTNTKPS